MDPPCRGSRPPHRAGHRRRNQGTVLILPRLPRPQSIPILLLHRGSQLPPLRLTPLQLAPHRLVLLQPALLQPVPPHHKLALRLRLALLHRPAPHRSPLRPRVIQLRLLLGHNHRRQLAALLILLRNRALD